MRGYNGGSATDPEKALKHVFFLVVEKRPVPLDHEEIRAVRVEASEQERRQIACSVARREDKHFSWGDGREGVVIERQGLPQLRGSCCH